MFSKALIVYKPAPACMDVARAASSLLKSRGFEVSLYWVDDLIGGAIPGEALVLVVGGDGTLLRLSRLVKGRSPLILPLPCGRRLAFYEDVPSGDIGKALDMLFSGNFVVELLPRVKATIGRAEMLALNEVLVANVDQGRTGKFEIAIKAPGDLSEFLLEGDGVIVGPSPGSSAYNLSARGPLIYPSYPSIFVNFLNPIQLNLAPMVLPFVSEVEVRPKSASAVYVDGERVGTLSSDRLVVKPSLSWLRVVRFKNPRRGLLGVLSKRAFSE